MLPIRINSVIVGVTTQTVKEIEGNLILEFHVDERISDKEASNFTVEIRHSSNNKYLLNKMTSINQNARVMTVVLVALLSNMNATSTQQNLLATLGKNPIPNMTNEQSVQDQNNQDNTENTKESN
ncbi:hypothetical protein F8M41_001920 [Gigaspora margarita]|uniref:Uncharacterized protein n=1 Tax=Gigaspora margarita TaxID=4874 RepID=A0A8H4A8V7_GIGMA|nr:hypothetical protein F8M41_001920 [Gigaspora margarita]